MNERVMKLEQLHMQLRKQKNDFMGWFEKKILQNIKW